MPSTSRSPAGDGEQSVGAGGRGRPGGRVTADLSLALAMAIAGSSVVVAAVVAADLPVFLANELRFLLASAVLVPLVARRVGGLPTFSRRDARVLVAQALTGVFLFNVCLFYGVRLTTAAAAGVVTSTTPAFVGVVGVIVLDETLTADAVAGIVFAVLGVAVLEVPGSGGPAAASGAAPLLGNALVLVGVVGEALFTVLGKATGDRVTPLVTTAAVSVLGAVLFLPFAAYEAVAVGVAGADPLDWLGVAYYGLVVTALAFLLWFRGVGAVPAHTAAAYTGVLPVSAVVLSAVLLGESVGTPHVVGVGCVLVAIGFAARRQAGDDG